MDWGSSPASFIEGTEAMASARSSKGRMKDISILGAGVAAVLILKLAADSIFTSLFSSFMFFFGFSTTMSTVGEMSAWSLDYAFSSFNIVLLLAAGGCVWLAGKIKKEHSPAALFALVWAVVIFAATCAHLRSEYYFVACVALLAAVCITETVKIVMKRYNAEKKELKTNRANKNRIKTKSAGKKDRFIKIIPLVLILGLAAGGAGISTVSSIDMATSNAASGTISPYWDETCEWLKDNTPDTGIPIYDNYSWDKTYESAKPYAIMSWWDYGYYIMELAKRMPTSNPGQVRAGDVARILLDSDEKSITEELEALEVKYIIINEEMSSPFIPAICTWADPDVGINPYITLLQNAEGSIGTLYSPALYQSLLTRLYCYDGSSMHPEQVGVIHTMPSIDGVQRIESMEVFDGAEKAAKAVDIYNQKAEEMGNGKYTYPASVDGNLPSVNLDAFTCFRLVHESPFSHVKTFEFVNGARISGEGTIECEVTTDQGRTFTYRQESVNGEFVVPYVTGKNGSVIASEYRIVETGKQIFVSEDAVQAKNY